MTSPPFGSCGLALVGFMASGKSTVGLQLAARLGLPFVDTDAELVRRHGSIAVQFAQEGEAAFRAREHALVQSLTSGGPRVLATGGGTYVQPSIRALLDDHYVTVHLKVSWATVQQRMAEPSSGAPRPLWDADVKARFDARQTDYARAAWQVVADRRSVEDVVEELVTRFRSQG